MSARALHLVVPGPLRQRTGGYLYDARMVDELRARGRCVVVHELEGALPASLHEVLAAVDDGAAVVVDGLAGGGCPEVLAPHARRLRLVALVHHPLADETGLDHAAIDRLHASERAALASCRGVVVTSRFTAGRIEAFGVSGERVKVAVPGTDRAERARGPGAEAPPRLLCVASLTRRKGHDVLLDALSSVADLPWSCVLAGSDAHDPSHARSLRARVARHGLEGRVSFVGELDAATLDTHYRGSTLFVLASHYEGYGMALTEAIMRGLPVVSTTGGAIPFTVPEDAGILVPPGDTATFGAALRHLLTDPDRLSALRAGALRAAERLPDWAQASHDFEAAVDGLSALHPPDGAGASS